MDHFNYQINDLNENDADGRGLFRTRNTNFFTNDVESRTFGNQYSLLNSVDPIGVDMLSGIDDLAPSLCYDQLDHNSALFPPTSSTPSHIWSVQDSDGTDIIGQPRAQGSYDNKFSPDACFGMPRHFAPVPLSDTDSIMLSDGANSIKVEYTSTTASDVKYVQNHQQLLHPVAHLHHHDIKSDIASMQVQFMENLPGYLLNALVQPTIVPAQIVAPEVHGSIQSPAVTLSSSLPSRNLENFLNIPCASLLFLDPHTLDNNNEPLERPKLFNSDRADFSLKPHGNVHHQRKILAAQSSTIYKQPHIQKGNKMSGIEIYAENMNTGNLKYLKELPETIVMNPLRTRKLIPKRPPHFSNNNINISFFKNSKSMTDCISETFQAVNNESQPKVMRSKNRRKQRLNNIPGSDNLIFEIQFTSSEYSPHISHSSIGVDCKNDTDPYPETELAAIDEIFKRKKKNVIVPSSNANSATAQTAIEDNCKKICEMLHQPSTIVSESTNNKSRRQPLESVNTQLGLLVSDAKAHNKMTATTTAVMHPKKNHIKIASNKQLSVICSSESDDMESADENTCDQQTYPISAFATTSLKCQKCKKLLKTKRSLAIHFKRCSSAESAIITLCHMGHNISELTKELQSQAIPNKLQNDQFCAGSNIGPITRSQTRKVSGPSKQMQP